mmetsp:Transcript_187/g.219  ORF Transcript_187/g.219 Transcript_187/m.219 type:complete len:294 (-) Transcript_187:16-897(-)
MNQPIELLANDFETFSYNHERKSISDFKSQLEILYETVQHSGTVRKSSLDYIIALLPTSFHNLQPRQIIYSHALPCSVLTLYNLAFRQPDNALKGYRISSEWIAHSAFEAGNVRIVIYSIDKKLTTRCLEFQTANLNNSSELSVRSIIFFLDHIHDYYAETTLYARDEGLARCTIRHRARLCSPPLQQCHTATPQKDNSWQRVKRTILAWEQHLLKKIPLYHMNNQQHSTAGIRSLFSAPREAFEYTNNDIYVPSDHHILPASSPNKENSKVRAQSPIFTTKQQRHQPCCLLS